MKKINKSIVKVMASAAVLSSVVAPVVALPGSSFAAGSGSVSALTVPSVANTAQGIPVGTIQIKVPQYQLSGNNNTVTVTLPKGVKLPKVTVGTQTYYDFNGTQGAWNGTGGTEYGQPFTGFSNSVTVAQSGMNGTEATNAGISGSALPAGAVTVLGDNQIKITLNGANGSISNNSDDTILNVNLAKVDLNGASGGPANATLAAPSDSSFPAGNVTIANVSSNGSVDLAATDTTSGSSKFTFNLNLTEAIAGSLRHDTTALKLKLPSGYVWTTAQAQTVTQLLGSEIYGENNGADHIKVSQVSGDTLYINYDNGNTSTDLNKSTSATSVKIPLSFVVNDDNQVKAGPVTVYVSGTTTVNQTSLVVGQYGDYSASVEAASTPDIFAGKAQQTIGDITIKESVPGTFVDGRTITLTLPDTARWEDVFDNIAASATVDKGGSVTTSGTTAKNIDSNGQWTPTVNLTFTNGLHATATYSGTDYRTLKLTFDGNGSLGNSDPGEIDLKNVQIATSARAKGDISVDVAGTSGVTGTVKVAAAKAPGSIAVSDVKNIKPGLAGQPIGDITITEAAAGAFSRDYVGSTDNNSKLIAVKLDAAGVKWDANPTVTVDGDAKITNVYSVDNYLYMTLDSASGAAPATIKLTGGTVKTDNTTPVGTFKAKLSGGAVDYAANMVATWKNDTTTAASADVANVDTGLFGNSGNKVVFTIGQTGYTLNGAAQTFDAAPFIDANGRTLLPVRALSEALGATVGWDQDSQTVSVLKDGKAISVTVGAGTLNVGGVKVAMDTVAVNKDGRVYLPFRAIAEALGSKVAWDATAQTVTLN